MARHAQRSRWYPPSSSAVASGVLRVRGVVEGRENRLRIGENRRRRRRRRQRRFRGGESRARAKSAPPRPKSAGMCASNAAFAIAAYPRGWARRPEDVVGRRRGRDLDPASASQHSTQITTAAARTPSKRSAAAECSSASACGNADAGAPAARNVSASVSGRATADSVVPDRCRVATHRGQRRRHVPRVDESPADQKRLSLRATRLRGRFRVHGERRGRSAASAEARDARASNVDLGGAGGGRRRMRAAASARPNPREEIDETPSRASQRPPRGPCSTAAWCARDANADAVSAAAAAVFVGADGEKEFVEGEFVDENCPLRSNCALRSTRSDASQRRCRRNETRAPSRGRRAHPTWRPRARTPRPSTDAWTPPSRRRTTIDNRRRGRGVHVGADGRGGGGGGGGFGGGRGRRGGACGDGVSERFDGSRAAAATAAGGADSTM